MKKVQTFLFLMLALCYPTQSRADSLYVILDGSGSMWGRIEKKIKIVEAKKVLLEIVNQTPLTLPMGLTVYGHKRKGDCSDITELFSLTKLDAASKKDAISAIKAIKPMGKTPLASSLEKVAANISQQDESSTIVLISDGIETCGGDPCATVTKLRQSGIKFVFHVVGLDVDKNAAEQLSCIAQAGGGKYFAVSKTEELFEILHALQKNITENKEIEIKTEEPEPEKIVQKVKSSSTSIRIKAAGPGKIQFEHDSWLTQPKYWKLVDPETGKVKGSFQGLNLTLVPPGEYQLLWRQCEHGCSEVTLAEVITVKSGKTSTVPLFTALRLNLPDWAKPPRYWGLQHPDTGEIVASFSHIQPYLVPAGIYNIVWKQSEHGSKEVALHQIEIQPDMLNTVALQTAFHPVAADWVHKNPYVWGLKKKGEKKEWVSWFKGAFSPQLVPPGDYDLYYDISEHGSTDSYLGSVQVKPGKLNEVQVNTGFTFIPSAGIGKPYFIEFIELDKRGKELRNTRLMGSFGPIALKPGKYKINYRQKQHNDSTMTIVESFDLPPGALVEIEL